MQLLPIEKKVMLNCRKMAQDEECVPNWIFDIDEKPASELLKEFHKEPPAMKLTEEKVVKQIYALGRVLSHVFQQFNLHYWTSGGTTLGILRHKGLIPWDDDLDLCILQENEPKLINEIAPVLKSQHKIQVVPANSVGYRIFHSEDSSELAKSDLINYRYPFCDIFVMSKEKKGSSCYIADRTGRTIWPQEKYKIRDIENPQEGLFGDFYLKCPLNPEEYLSNTYGADWSTIGATQSYCHLWRESKYSIQFDLDSYEPAKPFQ